MLTKIKTLLELSDTTFDTEITNSINMAIADLQDIGIETAVHITNGSVTGARPSIEKAIELYCMKEFALAHGYPGNYDQIVNAYDNIRDRLKKSKKYRSTNG